MPDFLDDGIGWQAATLAAHERDDAVGAAGIAAVLDLEGRPRVTALSAEDRGGEQDILFENITGQDIAKTRTGIRLATLGIRLRPLKGMERGGRFGTQASGGEKVVYGLGELGRGSSRERIDELWDLRFVGIADDPGDTGKRRQFFWSALGIASGDDDADGGIGGVELADGVAGLGVGGSRDRAGVDDDDVGGAGRGDRGAATVKQLALEGSAIGLRGAATELFDVESRYLEAPHGTETHFKPIQERTGNAEKRKFPAVMSVRTERRPGPLRRAPHKDSRFAREGKDR